MKRKNILFTGPPGCGKSTLIEKIVAETKRPTTGFFTREMREHRRRVGFSINTLKGKAGFQFKEPSIGLHFIEGRTFHRANQAT